MVVRIVWRSLVAWGVWCGGFAGCSPLAAAPDELVVSAKRPWTATSIQLRVGQPVTIDAQGTARMVGLTAGEVLFGSDFDRLIGPEGTYVWPRDYPTHRPRRHSTTFPLPAGIDGPNPAFCLLGKIGQNGEPFYVGRHYEGTADRAGALWLGINDDDVSDNHGAFTVRILLDQKPEAAAPTPASAEPTGRTEPAPHNRVLLLYVDGLRPDVVHEMAARGFLPNMTRVFLDGGLECANAFTTFPSNTLTANGALFTGLLSNRTGIKSQNQFERTTRKPTGQLSEWLPHWLWVRTTSQPRVSDLLDKFAPENTHQFLRQRGVPTLGSRLGLAYRFTILPIAPMNPPSQWLHRAMNELANPFVASVRIPIELDRVNASYLMEELLGDPEARVIAAWFPMVDKVSHHTARGQFGGARREVALFDRFLGQILKRLRQVGWDSSTYLILVSDHGHLGGEQTVNRHCHLARDYFYQRLGCNVKVVGQEWMHPGQDPERFVFLDHQAWAQAEIFLPKASYSQGPWERNALSELTRYDVGPNRAPVNLLESLSQFTGPEWERGAPKPVDLILVKLDATRVVVYRSGENQALIHTRLGDDGREQYRYEPIRQIRQASEGSLQCEPAKPNTDPLGFLVDPSVRQAVGPGASVANFLAGFHTAEEWLRVTAGTSYPDAVVGMATFFSWQPPVDDLAAARDPDLVVTASRGWSFRSDEDVGTDHGSPLRESMRISLFLAGPHLRHGVLLEPDRIVDVLPTILEMIHWPYDSQQLDGRPIPGIYED